MANWWTLKIISGERAGQTFTLKPEKTVIGRKKGDLVLRQDPEMSGKHAELTFDRDTNTFTLVDLGSRNGCRVNGQQVKVHQLSAGDKIRIGTTDLVLLAPEVQTASARAEVAVAVEQPEALRSEHPKFISKPDQLQIHGFWRTFARLFFKPREFFQAVAIQQSTRHALRFATLNWFVGWALALFLILVLALLLKMAYDIKSVAALVIAGLSSLLLIPIFVPITTIVFHVSSRVFKGRASLGKAFQIACYSTAFTVAASVLELVPKAGKYLSLIPLGYSVYVMALAAVHVYDVQRKRAFAAWGAFGFVSLCAVVVLQEHGSKIKNAFFASQINANPAEVVFIMKATYRDAIKDAVVGSGEQRVPAGN